MFLLRLTETNTMPLAAPVLLGQAASSPGGDDSQYVLWAILLLVGALVLFFMELFIPSGGLLGLCSAVSMIVGIVFLFKVDTTLGLVCAIISLASIPFLFAFALKLWPNTPLARLLILETPSPAGHEPVPLDPGPTPGDLVGKSGQALTDLHPVGTCLIEGYRLDCLAEAGLIPSGSRVRVMSVTGKQIRVRAEDTENL